MASSYVRKAAEAWFCEECCACNASHLMECEDCEEPRPQKPGEERKPTKKIDIVRFGVGDKVSYGGDTGAIRFDFDSWKNHKIFIRLDDGKKIHVEGDQILDVLLQKGTKRDTQQLEKIQSNWKFDQFVRITHAFTSNDRQATALKKGTIGCIREMLRSGGVRIVFEGMAGRSIVVGKQRRSMLEIYQVATPGSLSKKTLWEALKDSQTDSKEKRWAIRFAVARGCDVNALEGARSPLLYATKAGWAECVRTLVSLRADTDKCHKDADGTTPLMLAVYGRRGTEIARTLLQARADVCRPMPASFDRRRPAVMDFVMGSNHHDLKELLKRELSHRERWNLNPRAPRRHNENALNRKLLSIGLKCVDEGGANDHGFLQLPTHREARGWLLCPKCGRGGREGCLPTCREVPREAESTRLTKQVELEPEKVDCPGCYADDWRTATSTEYCDRCGEAAPSPGVTSDAEVATQMDSDSAGEGGAQLEQGCQVEVTREFETDDSAAVTVHVGTLGRVAKVYRDARVKIAFVGHDNDDGGHLAEPDNFGHLRVLEDGAGED